MIKTVVKYKLQSQVTGWYCTFKTLEEAIAHSKVAWEYQDTEVVFSKITTETEILSV